MDIILIILTLLLYIEVKAFEFGRVNFASRLIAILIICLFVSTYIRIGIVTIKRYDQSVNAQRDREKVLIEKGLKLEKLEKALKEYKIREELESLKGQLRSQQKNLQRFDDEFKNAQSE